MKNTKIFLILIITIILITMGIFNILASKSNADKKFVTEENYIKNKENQIKMTPSTLEQLRKIGVSEEKKLKLEYFFYTNSEEKAKKLAEEIQEQNFSTKYGKSVGDKKLFIVTGWTKKMIMSNDVVIQWTKNMCNVGYKFDCEFDGWGTEPDQE